MFAVCLSQAERKRRHVFFIHGGGGEKISWFHLDLFSFASYTLTARWCAIFTHTDTQTHTHTFSRTKTQSNHPESSGDISAVEIGVSRIHNTIIPHTHWFFFNAVRILLTWRKRQRKTWWGSCCIFWCFRQWLWLRLRDPPPSFVLCHLITSNYNYIAVGQ